MYTHLDTAFIHLATYRHAAHVCDTRIYMYTHMDCETNLNAGHSLVFAGQYTKMQESPVECETIGKYDNRA